MSENKKTGSEETDTELDELLNSALEDFNKLPKLPTKKEDESSEAPDSVIEEPIEELVDETWSQDFIKQTTDQFEKNLQSLLQNGGDGEFSGSLQKMAQTVVIAISSNGTTNPEGNEFQAAITQAMKDISATSDTLENASPRITEADLTAMFGQTSLNESGNEMLSLIQGMMQSLLSKEILYPSLKEVIEKYPTWLEEKKDSLPEDELARFTKQSNLMQKVCTELEKEKDDDSEQVKNQRFEVIIGFMQELQTCGQPPEELVGEQSSLFQFANDENPMTPSLPAGVDPQNCNIM